MTHNDREPGKHTIWLLMGLVMACALATGAVIFLIPPRLESHDDQIAYVLKQHGIAYEQIKLTQTSRDTQYYTAYAGYTIYGADVMVQLPHAGQVIGRIECRVKDSDCKLYLVDVGLRHEPLPELNAREEWFWLDWLRQRLPRLGATAGSRLA